MGSEQPVTDAFDKIGEEVSERASAIRCSVADYVDGLRTIIGRLEVDIEAAQEMDGGDVEPAEASDGE